VRGDSNRKEFRSSWSSPGRRKTMVFWSKFGDLWQSWAPGRVQWGAVEDGEGLRCTWGSGELMRRMGGKERCRPL
jgi:hypothetical protein